MHPLLKSPKQVVMLVAAWLPVIAGVSFIHTLVTEATFVDGLILLGPAMALELFIFLSVWFVCKSTPLEVKTLGSFLIRHIVTIVVINAIWLHMVMLYSQMLDMGMETDKWLKQFDATLPVLMVVGFFLYFVSGMLSYLLLTLEYARKAEREALENQLKASEAEIRFLKATIHPHFLFNSLTALGTLTKVSADKAQDVCLQLAEFLRYSLTYNNKDLVTVEDELGHVQNYLGVEKIRLGRRLAEEFDIDKTLLKNKILSFSLQPLIENAIKHGIEPCVDGGTISMTLKKSQDIIFINISNPYDNSAVKKESTGHGLANLKARLKKMYDDEAKILVHKGASAFSVNLYIPITK